MSDYMLFVHYKPSGQNTFCDALRKHVASDFTLPIPRTHTDIRCVTCPACIAEIKRLLPRPEMSGPTR